MKTHTTTICAWCDREAGVTRPYDTSHGICPSHRAQLLAEYRRGTPADDLGAGAPDLAEAISVARRALERASRMVQRAKGIL